MKTIAGLILAGSSLFAAPVVSVGVRFGSPAPIYTAPAYAAPAYVAPAYVPPCPGPDYVFVNGYWQRRHVIVEHRERRDFDRHENFRRDYHRR